MRPREGGGPQLWRSSRSSPVDSAAESADDDGERNRVTDTTEPRTSYERQGTDEGRASRFLEQGREGM